MSKLRGVQEVISQGRPKGSKNTVIPGTDLINTTKNMFYSKVCIPSNDKGCMEWIGSKRNGYGRIRINGKVISAHRLSYEINVGKIPDGMCVCHFCDNPSCVRPSHLFIGTLKDNNRDRAKKGRTFIASGQKNGNSKLTDKQVKDIKTKIKIGYSSEDLSILYHVSIDTIFKIKSTKYWESV